VTAPVLWLPARAKLNLVLRVVGRRADGYHLLETLFHALALHDDLWLARADGGDVALHSSADAPELAVPAGADNLVVRALRALQLAVGDGAPGFRAHLHKRIPHGGGLGGGSSDAAAALRLGNALLARPLADDRLGALASSLGADVRFFLSGGSQWGRGIGDELEVANVPPMHFVLVVPPFACPTAEVYRNHAALWNGGPPQGSVPAVTVPLPRDSAVRIGLANDLEPAAERVRPALRELRRRVADLGFPAVRMTGSGSTLFVACDSEADARRCADRLAPLAAAPAAGSAAGPPVRLVVTRSATVSTDQPIAREWPQHQAAASGEG
jgi:4-diphosphocytidyl-2-C-methyl-D-erythritol kinase